MKERNLKTVFPVVSRCLLCWQHLVLPLPLALHFHWMKNHFNSFSQIINNNIPVVCFSWRPRFSCHSLSCSHFSVYLTRVLCVHKVRLYFPIFFCMYIVLVVVGYSNIFRYINNTPVFMIKIANGLGSKGKNTRNMNEHVSHLSHWCQPVNERVGEEKNHSLFTTCWMMKK